MRKSGVLMHISSLPSAWGVGTLGIKARDFIDFLSKSGQSYWQVLPVSPTGFGDSPYQSFCSYAGNPYFIDLDILNSEGLLKSSEYESINWAKNACLCDYNLLYKNRFNVLKIACNRLASSKRTDLETFFEDNSHWLDDYALFMALKDEHKGAPWFEWDIKLRFRDEEALNNARLRLSGSIVFYKLIQYLFYRQWEAMKAYANSKGISIIGDIPIYSSLDSSEVWASTKCFMLDSELKPSFVAGCPPDSFTEDGQLWGNPLYDWEYIKEGSYKWWILRVAHQLTLFDVLRIDHFRGFDEFYCIPYGAENARNGVWRKGPGLELFISFTKALGKRQFIAEDLGFLTDSVRKLLKDSGYPGMRVMQFAFNGDEENPYLPHKYIENCVAYTGTHDNDTIKGWFSSAPDDEVDNAKKYLQIKEEDNTTLSMLRALWSSDAGLTIVQMQDLLELGSEARMNTPGTLSGNWQWRMSAHAPLDEVSQRLLKMTAQYKRI